MSYSSLVDYVRISPNSTNPRPGEITDIVLHHMACNLTVEECGNGFSKPSRQASSNYGIGTDGRIACYVEEENRAWTTGAPELDGRAITIEVANCSGAPDWKVSDQALESTIALCVDICRRHGFRLNYTGNKTGNLHMHKWYQPTACPGPYLGGKFPYIAEEVNRRLDAEQGAENKPAEAPTVPQETAPDFVLGMRYLSKGCEGGDVRALQQLLIANGYPCGMYGPDGKFGPATDSALRNCQQEMCPPVDGVAGPIVMGCLLGLD